MGCGLRSVAREMVVKVSRRFGRTPSSTVRSGAAWLPAEGPDGNGRGVYLVSTSATDFSVGGFCDVDGDGSMANYTETKLMKADMTSGNNIY